MAEQAVKSLYSDPMFSDAASKITDPMAKLSMQKSELEYGISESERADAERKKRAEASILQMEGESGALSKPFEEFKPSQETMGGFIALGSMLAVSGAMLGMKGKFAGLAAMNSIAGMMKGYQSGRKDLYEQERQKFEENMKVWEKNRTMVKEAFDRALKMAPYNLTTAQNVLRRDLKALGVEIPSQMVDKSGVMPTHAAMLNLHEGVDKVLDHSKATLGSNKAKLAAITGLMGAYNIQEAQQTKAQESELKKLQLTEIKQKVAGTFRTYTEAKNEAEEKAWADAIFSNYEKTKEIPVLATKAEQELYAYHHKDAPFDTVSEKDRLQIQLDNYRLDDEKTKAKNNGLTQFQKIELDAKKQETENYKLIADAIYNQSKETGEIPVITNDKVLAQFVTDHPGEKFTQQKVAGQGLNKGSVMRILAATANATDALDAMTGIRGAPSTGILPYLSTKEGLISYLENKGGRAITDDEAKILKTYQAGVKRSLAIIEGVGSATGLVALTGLMGSLDIELGDSNMVVAAKLADTRRVIESVNNEIADSGFLTKDEKSAATAKLNELKKIVPFTYKDVNNVVYKNDPTLGDRLGNLFGPDKGKSPSSTTPETSKIPRLRGREIEVRGGKWVFKDTGEDAK